MCGIIGYIGYQNAQPILVDGLKRLEYRGYDSAGIAVYTKQGLKINKAQGKLNQLEAILPKDTSNEGTVGIGHTRWATHGKPSDVNSHPHYDESGKFAVVHNGIIENYMALKEQLEAKGYTFQSETDTEVLAHLIADLYDGDIVTTVQAAVKQLKGAFALAVLTEHEPGKLVAVRMASPLIIGLGDNEYFIASDIPAILKHTKDVYILKDGEMAILTANDIKLQDTEGKAIKKEKLTVDWDVETAEKAGYAHFMLKEIEEQPKAYRQTMSARIDSAASTVNIKELALTSEQLQTVKNIHIVACGTAYHAGLVGKHVIEKLTRIPVETDVASEYRYRDPIINKNTLVIVVSQSGETADTLAALREAQAQGAKVIAITNVVGSSVAREADAAVFTWAGPEIAVASTKAYTSQLIAFYLLGVNMAQLLKSYDVQELKSIVDALQKLPEQVEQLLAQTDIIKKYANSIKDHRHLFFIGRGIDYAVAQEGSLKLKEISYIHSEAYAAGELKHGTLALIEEGTPVIALATQQAVADKMISNIREVATRGARIFGIAAEERDHLVNNADDILYIPTTLDLLSPALSVIPLQLLSYYTATALGNDVDQPRNLAKSVTVE